MKPFTGRNDSMSEETGGTIEKRDIPVNIEDIMHTAYLQYSLSVNVVFTTLFIHRGIFIKDDWHR